jgi:hypothetical protein
VLDLPILNEGMRGIHDLRYAGLVVRTEQRGAVGCDDVVADLVLQGRMLGDADHLRGVAGKGDVAAAIVPDELRLDVPARAVGRRVHMGAETDHRHFLLRVCRNGRVDITVLVEMGIADSHRPQFGDQQATEIFLLLGRRISGRGRIGLGVDDYVTQEAFGHRVRERWGRHHRQEPRLGLFTSITKSVIPGPRNAPE